MSKNKEFISLAEYNHELVLEWHPEKNVGITPESISYGSAKKIWWKCSEGHEWQATPNHRSQGRGCPYCIETQRTINRIKSRIANVGSLADNNPELAREWHLAKNGNLTPKDVTANSSKKVWWQCARNDKHEWQAAINSRNSGVGCPVCSGHKIVVGINDLATVRPDLAYQWHNTKNGNLKPTEVTLNNAKSVWWQCEKGHEWQAKIANRGNGNNCPICIGKKVLVGYNDLATVMPGVAKEWHPIKNGELTPKDVTAGSNKKVWWQCERGHEWQTSIAHRSNGRRCPKCFGESKTSFPEQAIFFYMCKITTAYNRFLVDSRTEIDIYLPEHKIGIEYDGAYFHNSEKAKQRENRKQEALESLGITLIRVREIKGDDEKDIVYSKPGANDLELTNTIETLCEKIASLIGRSFDVDIDVSRDRNKIYEQYIQSEKENSLAVVNPKLASEWHPTMNGSLLPEYITAHSNKSVWWKCENNHEWRATVNSRNAGSGCMTCYRFKKKTNR